MSIDDNVVWYVVLVLSVSFARRKVTKVSDITRYMQAHTHTGEQVQVWTRPQSVWILG